MNIDDGTNLFYLVDEFLLFDFGALGEVEEKAIYTYFLNEGVCAKNNSDRYKRYLFSFYNKITRR